MQAVILAGGLGTRLKPLTEQIPKVMAPVNGKPFLQYLLGLLKNQKIIDIVLCIGYLGRQVRDYFGNGERVGLNIRYSEEKERLLGTGGALKQAQSLLEGTILVINGDTYLPVDYLELEKIFFRNGKNALMVVYDNQEDTGVKPNVELDDNLTVVRHDKESSDPRLRYVEAGVLLLRREVLDTIEPGHCISLEKGLYPSLIKRREMAAFISKSRFFDIGTPGRQVVFAKYLENAGREPQ